MSPNIDSALVPLDRAEIVEITGTDALAFAHAQFASDVHALEPSSWQWSAWLTAQGRTRAVFPLLRIDADRLLMWLPLGGADAMRDALARFVLRAKVALAVRDDWMLCRLDDGRTPSAHRLDAYLGGIAFAQPGAQTRRAWLGPAPATSRNAEALDMWRRDDIAAGLPWISEATRDEFVPQALDLERLDAISFDKGCYPGQEIVARLHFRGGNKRRLRRLVLAGKAPLPPGLAIERAGDAVGTVLYGAPSSAGYHEALAVLIDDASDATTLISSTGRRVEENDDSFYS
ncbi:MAG TPA: folate-binding protein [Rhodanobacteraceae bacterium]|jgi:folate-binding protein YgfZ|nr:folate-binding protein [Rhodanobacteraceae bacterium]